MQPPRAAAVDSAAPENISGGARRHGTLRRIASPRRTTTTPLDLYLQALGAQSPRTAAARIGPHRGSGTAVGPRRRTPCWRSAWTKRPRQIENGPQSRRRRRPDRVADDIAARENHAKRLKNPRRARPRPPGRYTPRETSADHRSVAPELLGLAEATHQGRPPDRFGERQRSVLHPGGPCESTQPGKCRSKRARQSLAAALLAGRPYGSRTP